MMLPVPHAAAADARADPMAPYYDATLECALPGGFECHIWYEKNGRALLFYVTVARGGSFAVGGDDGTYRLEGGPGSYRLCVAYRGKKKTCTAFVLHAVGDNWSSPLLGGPHDGATAQMRLVAGRK